MRPLSPKRVVQPTDVKALTLRTVNAAPETQDIMEHVLMVVVPSLLQLQRPSEP